MPHSDVSNLMHCVFSTNERLPLIWPELESRLWPYLGGIARENKRKAMAIAGTLDHLHALLSLPSTMSFAKAVQLIKGGSSKWMHDTFREYQKFAAGIRSALCISLISAVRFTDFNHGRLGFSQQ